MAIDTTPSTVATNALQAIPFSSLIGGPLDACIQAQAQAAQTTWDFIKNVGLNEDKATGKREAVTVIFQYQKGGEMVNLVVPLLTIVPIPYIAIETIDIDFKANISASSSSISEVTESTAASGEAQAELSVGWGPFSIKASMKANYSSKKDSKASQESKYSVEYTMNVTVHAAQSDMPAGLASVLNILQSSITEANPDGKLTVTVDNTLLNPGNYKAPVTASIAPVSSRGQNLPNQALTISLGAPPTGFTVASIDVLQGTGTLTATGGTLTTDNLGAAALKINLTPLTADVNLTADTPMVLGVKTTIVEVVDQKQSSYTKDVKKNIVFQAGTYTP